MLQHGISRDPRRPRNKHSRSAVSGAKNFKLSAAIFLNRRSATERHHLVAHPYIFTDRLHLNIHFLSVSPFSFGIFPPATAFGNKYSERMIFGMIERSPRIRRRHWKLVRMEKIDFLVSRSGRAQALVVQRLRRKKRSSASYQGFALLQIFYIRHRKLHYWGRPAPILYQWGLAIGFSTDTASIDRCEYIVGMEFRVLFPEECNA